MTIKKSEVPEEFKAPIAAKHKDESKLKSQPRHVYLKNRLEAIEAAIKHFFGPKELARVGALYEGEFTRRILEAREH